MLMNSEGNTEYYLSDESLNFHIDNILSYKKFLENILLEIKSNKYNKNMIKLLSRHIDKSLSEISNDTTLFEFDKNEEDDFVPSVKIVSVDSDTSDSISDDELITKKLEFYEAKMNLYESHMTPKSEPNTLAHKKIYEEDNDFEIIHYNPEPVIESKNFTSIQNITDTKPYVSDFKPKDKLVYDFLNDKLELDNYNYLKFFDLNRIDNYCNSVKIY
jgi:hypothetical protein